MLFGIALVLTAWSGGCLTACLRLNRRVDNALAWWLLLLAQIILVTLVLSPLHAIRPSGYLLGHGGIFLVSTALWILRGRPVPDLKLGALGSDFKEAALRRRGLLLLGATVALLVLVHLVLTLCFRSRNYDSFSYHLSRAAYWLQQESLEPFPTHNLRQTTFPPNASILYLWPMTFLRSDRLGGLVALSAYAASALAVFSLSRTLGASRSAAVFAALLWASLPENFLLSSLHTDHLLAGVLPVVSLALAIHGLADGRRSLLALSGLAVGLSIGVKFTAVLAALALGVAVAAVSGQRRQARPFAVWAASCLLCTLVFSGWIYVKNYQIHGDLFGGPAYNVFKVEHPGPRIALANAVRCGYQFLDFTGFFYLDRPFHQLEAKCASLVGRAYDFNPPGSYSFEPFLPDQLLRRRSADSAWYGPVGFAALLPCWWLAWRRRQPLSGALACAVVAYVLPVLILFTWNPWFGRFFVFPVALGAAFLPEVFRSPRLKALPPVMIGIALTSVLSLLISGSDRSLHGAGSIWEEIRGEGRFPTCKEHGRRSAELDRLLGDRPVRMGILAGGNDLDYPYFGPGYCRRMIPFPLQEAVTSRTIESNNLEYLLASPSRALDSSFSAWRATPLSEGWSLLQRPPP